VWCFQQERVQQLNKAIDAVRRQLEQLQPLP
jgi:polyhydroxyalkanoate synthesis regulator phasin